MLKAVVVKSSTACARLLLSALSDLPTALCMLRLSGQASWLLNSAFQTLCRNKALLVCQCR